MAFVSDIYVGPEEALAPPARIATLSVVLPCANESEFVWKTIRSVFDATPDEQLKEIIVVDDASDPPIHSDVATEFLTYYRARVIRHDRPEGLIRSKKDGGDAATGDAIVFLDCHVKPMENWTGPILANLQENPRRVVVPSVTVLDPDTWEEVSPYGGGSKMCLTWNADFTWCNQYPGPYVPIMSGGLLALTQFWWRKTGGYDDQMLSWGGENLDQSLRTWLCGGEIMVAEGSRVAHMWRDPRKPHTMMKYVIPSDHTRRNRLRAATAWLGAWAQKVRSFQEFEAFGPDGELSVGSLDNIERDRAGLGCGDFASYLDRFRDLYLDTGMLPERVFHLRKRGSQLCLHHEKVWDESMGLKLAPCSRRDERQRFHGAAAKDGGGCCSGLKVWDLDECVNMFDVGSTVHAFLRASSSGARPASASP
ncbi:unnamed protein product [Prorocentrum cordatum]|uniref:Polypeptide N-acetylgalactosaminyltransferase n=1 Tax=Prorocentrum cordatum TaxID=2364126 RepID=A0ABN9WRJ9_9DINO|nr:unnamed protein product [Polarella glacialis]